MSTSARKLFCAQKANETFDSVPGSTKELVELDSPKNVLLGEHGVLPKSRHWVTAEISLKFRLVYFRII